MNQTTRLLLAYAITLVLAFTLTYCLNEGLEGMDLAKRVLLNFAAIRFCIGINNRILTGNWSFSS